MHTASPAASSTANQSSAADESAWTTPRSSTGSTSFTPPAPQASRLDAAIVDRHEDRHHPLDARVRDLVLVRAEAGAAGLFVVELVLERGDGLAERAGARSPRADRPRAPRSRRGTPTRSRCDRSAARSRSAPRSGPTRATRSATPRPRRSERAQRVELPGSSSPRTNDVGRVHRRESRRPGRPAGSRADREYRYDVCMVLSRTTWRR